MAEEITKDTDSTIKPKMGYNIFDDTAGAAVETTNSSLQPEKSSNTFDDTVEAVTNTTRTFGEKFLGVQPEAVTKVKKTFTKDFIPGSETVSKRELIVDKSKIQPYIKTQDIFQRDNPLAQKLVKGMIGFRTKNTQGDGYVPFAENSTYDNKIEKMNYMGALQYAYKTPAGTIRYKDIPYESRIGKLIEEPEGYTPPSIEAIGLKTLAHGGAWSPLGDATIYDDKKVSITNKDQGEFPEWMPFGLGGEKIGVTLDKALGTNYDATGFKLHLAKQYNKILIKAGLNPRQRLGIITERLDNNFKNIENIVGYARRGTRFTVETGGYLIGESYDMLTDDDSWAGGLGIKDSKKRNDFYDLILDKQANILQDGYARMGIDIDIGTAEIIATMFTSSPQRLAAVASEILIPSSFATKLVTKLSAREIKKYRRYHLKEKIKKDPAEKMTKEEKIEFANDTLEKFQALRNREFLGLKAGDIPFGVGATYRTIDRIVNGGRLTRGLQIENAGKKITQRPEVTAAIATRRNLINQRNAYLEGVKIKGSKTLQDEKKIAKLNNSVNMATENVRAMVLESDLPAFLRDVTRGNRAMIIGSASFGQLAQEGAFYEGADSQIFEVIGLFTGVLFDFGSNNRTIAGLIKKASMFTNASKKEIDFAQELGKRINTFSPQFKVQLEKRLQYIDNLKQDLIAENPKLEPVMKMGFAKLSGLSILQGIEETARLNISEKSIHSFGQTLEDLEKVTQLKNQLLNELASAAQNVSDIRRKAGDSPKLIQFQELLDKAYAYSKKRNDELAETIADLKVAQENEITDAINGTSDILNDGVDKSSDISTKLNTVYNLNVKNTNWKNEVEKSNMIQKTSDAVDSAVESKAKSLNRTALMNESKAKLNKQLKNEGVDSVEYNTFGDLMQTFSENVRNKSSANVTKEYTKLDTSKFVDGSGNLIGTEAKVEGVGLLDTFIDLIGKNNDTEVLMDLAGKNMGKSKRANLFNALDNAAAESVEKHFQTVNVNGQFENVQEFINSILENAPAGSIKSYLPKNLQIVDVLNQSMKSRGKTIDSIPLTFVQLKELKSAFSNLQSKYYNMQISGTQGAGNVSAQYKALKEKTSEMFFDFRVNFGEQDERAIGNMFVEVGDEIMPVTKVLENANTMHQTHMSRFFDNQDNWSKSFKGRNKVDPYNVRPTGITVDNSPESWFDFDKIADYNDAQVDEFQKGLFEFLGDFKGDELVVDTGSQSGKTLKALMQLKLANYLSDLAKQGKLDSSEYVTKLKNLERIFKVGRKDGKLESLIDIQKAEVDLFAYNPASVGTKLWEKGQRNLAARLKKLGLENVKPATEYLDRRRQVQNVLMAMSSETTDTPTLAQKMFQNGPRLNKVKDGLFDFYGGTVSREEIDKLVRDVYLEDLNDAVFQTTGRTVLSHKGELIPEVTMNLEVLKATTGFNNPAVRSQVKDLIGEKRLKVFDSMVKFCAEESATAIQRSNVTGVPRHFSVESYISRFYSINRGVISARYVGTEAVLQQFRMKGHNLFKSLIENPEAGELFLEIVKTGQPLSRQKEIVFFNVLTQALSFQEKLHAQNPEREIDLPRGWQIKHREYDKVNLT